MWSNLPPTIPEMLPEHPPSQDKQPIEKMKGSSDDTSNHLFPMVVKIVSPRVEIVGQGGLAW